MIYIYKEELLIYFKNHLTLSIDTSKNNFKLYQNKITVNHKTYYFKHISKITLKEYLNEDYDTGTYRERTLWANWKSGNF